MQFNDQLVVTAFYEGVTVADIFAAAKALRLAVEEKQIQVMAVVVSQDLLRDRLVISDGSGQEISVDISATGSACVTSVADPTASSVTFASERRLVRIQGTVALESAAPPPAILEMDLDAATSSVSSAAGSAVSLVPYIKAALLSVIEDDSAGGRGEADMLFRYRKALELRRVFLKRQGLIGKDSVSYYHREVGENKESKEKSSSSSSSSSSTALPAAATATALPAGDHQQHHDLPEER